jgi:putative ABC transport system ATP-binding protein
MPTVRDVGPSAVKPPLLVARDIVVDRDGHRIVSAANVTLADAAVVTVSGPSGCGKSTLLRAIATLIPTTSGEVMLEGREAHLVGLCEYRRRVSYVPQLPRMFEGSVADNVRAGPRFHGDALSEPDVAALLERVGLDAALATRPAKDLSGGERLRVALARSLANRPRVLLLDEPTSALDSAAAELVLDLLSGLARGGTALLAVTHSIEHAARLGGAAFRMSEGVLVPDGTTGARPLCISRSRCGDSRSRRCSSASPSCCRVPRAWTSGGRSGSAPCAPRCSSSPSAMRFAS